MSEPAAPDSPPASTLPVDLRPPARRVERVARRVQAWWRRGAERRGELGTVFLGVYMAFLLNNFQLHRQQRLRREQILAGLEADYTETLASIKSERVEVRKLGDTFNRQVEAGEMPPLHAFNFATDYDASDTASVLGGGGYDLLEVETVREIKDAESVTRLMIGLIRHAQQLSDTLILPNSEKDGSFFYDPAMKKLRPAYQWYAELIKDELKNYDILQPKVEKLLAQIRAERKRNR